MHRSNRSNYHSDLIVLIFLFGVSKSKSTKSTVETITAMSYIDTIKVILDYSLNAYVVIDVLTYYFRLTKESEDSNRLTLLSSPLAAIRYDPALDLMTSLLLTHVTRDLYVFIFLYLPLSAPLSVFNVGVDIVGVDIPTHSCEINDGSCFKFNMETLLLLILEPC